MTRWCAVPPWSRGRWAGRSTPGERSDLAEAGADDPRPDVRLAAVRALSGTRPNDPEISVWLRERTLDPDVSVANAAVRELGGRQPVPPITQVP